MSRPLTWGQEATSEGAVDNSWTAECGGRTWRLTPRATGEAGFSLSDLTEDSNFVPILCHSQEEAQIIIDRYLG